MNTIALLPSFAGGDDDSATLAYGMNESSYKWGNIISIADIGMSIIELRKNV